MLYSGLYYYMSSIETADGGNIYCTLGSIGAILLCAGSFVVYLTSKLRFIPSLFTLLGFAAILACVVLFFISDIVELFTQMSGLGVVQMISALAFLAAIGVTILYMMLSLMGVKILPGLGYLPAYIGLVALLLLLVRTMTSFASLKTSLGDNFKWALAAEEMPAEVSWVLRSVPKESPSAVAMFYARLLERIGALLLFSSTLPMFFRFASFFTEYNRQMELSSDIHRINRQAHPEQYEDEDDDDDPVDLGIFAKLKRNIGGSNSLVSDNARRADDIFTIGYTDGDTDDKSLPVTDRPQEDNIVYRRRPAKMPANFNLRSAGARENKASSPPAAQHNSETGAVKVKLRPVAPPPKKLPDPDDMSIWNNYKD